MYCTVLYCVLFSGYDLGMYGPGDTFTSSVNPTGILVVKFSVLAGGRPRHSTNHVEDSGKVGTRASNEPSRRWTAGCDVAGGGGGHLSRPLGLEVGPLSQLYVIIMLWIVNMNHEMYYV